MTKSEKQAIRLQRFIDRIGKRVFRNKNKCKCKYCLIREQEGMIVIDEDHAKHLLTCEEEYGALGVELNYRDEL